MVECNLAKVDVEGSNPFSRSIVRRSTPKLPTTWAPLVDCERAWVGGLSGRREGEVVREVPLTGEARSELEKTLAAQREKFIAKLGREPGPDDPIFFDLREDTAEAMRAAGIRPALIYAYEETGLIVTQENRR